MTVGISVKRWSKDECFSGYISDTAFRLLTSGL